MYPRRKNARLRSFDYAQPGAYFVTIVTAGREEWFGDIVAGTPSLSELGMRVIARWARIPTLYAGVDLGPYVVMPNHLHGLIHLNSSGQVPSLPRVIQSFKSVTTQDYYGVVPRPQQRGPRLWQVDYWERVVRDDEEYQRIGDYILANPANWEWDRENRAASGRLAGHGADWEV